MLLEAVTLFIIWQGHTIGPSEMPSRSVCQAARDTLLEIAKTTSPQRDVHVWCAPSMPAIT